ncbi:site-specific integrase [Azohydromonas lata]|uniref:Tyr recombinase domain-containing protein n=1 Tax=Azohydromonas lata TaxID=45677 RepID=A0ABU5I9M4_9BURK|nr:hypothetical protein [Azohydromonas lata]MDZ5455804.1 hypothetical protein [Azohydromonas lata]
MPDLPMLSAQEAHALVASIDTGTLTGLRDRAIVGLMGSIECSPAAVVNLVLGDVLQQDELLQVRLPGLDGQRQRNVPCLPVPQAWLQAYLDRAGLSEPDALVFRRGGMRADVLSRRLLSQREIFSMVNDRAEAAGVRARLTWGAFRTAGLSIYLINATWTVQP